MLCQLQQFFLCGLFEPLLRSPPSRKAPSTPHATLAPDAARPRTIIVGDVHGCLDELADLLVACEYDAGSTRVICVGDLVNKGPRSADIVRYVRSSGFHCVRGNHDEAALAAWERREAERADGGAADSCDKYAYTDSWSADDVRFISQLPYTLFLPEESTIVVHAGLLPNVPLREQPPRAMVTLRDVHRTSGGASESSGSGWTWSATIAPESTAWAGVWEPDDALGVAARHVVFGHDAKRGLQRHEHATGLDTGCCYGRELTALILPDWRIVSVPARACYEKPKSAG